MNLRNFDHRSAKPINQLTGLPEKPVKRPDKPPKALN